MADKKRSPPPHRANRLSQLFHLNISCHVNSTLSVHTSFMLLNASQDLSGFCMWFMKGYLHKLGSCDARGERACCVDLLDAVLGVKLWSLSLSPAGMIVQTMVFFLCLLIAVFLIIIPVLHRQNLILFQVLWSMWWASSHLLLIKLLCPRAALTGKNSPNVAVVWI